MATHSRILVLAWEIPWTEVPGKLQSMGLQRVGHDLASKQQQLYIYIYNIYTIYIYTHMPLWSIVSFKASVSLLPICLDVLSIDVSGVLKVPYDYYLTVHFFLYIC